MSERFPGDAQSLNEDEQMMELESLRAALREAEAQRQSWEDGYHQAVHDNGEKNALITDLRGRAEALAEALRAIRDMKYPTGPQRSMSYEMRTIARRALAGEPRQVDKFRQFVERRAKPSLIGCECPCHEEAAALVAEPEREGAA